MLSLRYLYHTIVSLSDFNELVNFYKNISYVFIWHVLAMPVNIEILIFSA
jgi:hypothetical protein